MPSLILTGHPCTGKSTFAHLLATRALRHQSKLITNVIHIRESTACPNQTKSECYSNSHNEKSTRAALKSEFDRAVMSSNGGSGDASTTTLIILDSLNYIKGYRYELFCISKAAGESHGVVWIMGGSSDGECLKAGVSSSSDELAKRRNRERKELQAATQKQDQASSAVEDVDLTDGYYEDDAAMESLVLRFEPPDEKNRWEKPLYKVDVSSVLPWGKDGTLEFSSEPSKLFDNKDESNTLTSQMKAVEVKDSSSQSIGLAKSAKKSASGFKRRTKKSAKKQTLSVQSSVEPTAPQMNVPSSMASRNLNLASAASSSDTNNQDQGNTNTSSKLTMENTIDGILDSFLMNTASLKQGESTVSHVSTEANVLNEVDHLTQRVNNEVLKGQKSTPISSGAGGRVFVSLSSVGSSNGDDRRCRAITLSKPLYANELRNFRRQFLKWIAGHPMPNGTEEVEIVDAYISYIESSI